MLGNTTNTETDSRSENIGRVNDTNETEFSQFLTLNGYSMNENGSQEMPSLNMHNSSSPSTIASDTDNSDADGSHQERRAQVRRTELPPIGVFWDIENCQVPRHKSAVGIVQFIRSSFFNGYREVEFLVVCDVKKENTHMMQELNDVQVTLVHVQATSKNAADHKLRQALRRFGDIHGSPAAVILISGDVNFASDLSDLRHRKNIHVILVHTNDASKALILSASEHYCYGEITRTLSKREIKGPIDRRKMEVVVKNLPHGYDINRLRRRLKQLSDNCGGRVNFISLNSHIAVLRFRNVDLAVRAQRRMDGEDVFGNKISVAYPNPGRSTHKSYAPYNVPARRVARRPGPEAFNPPMYGAPPANATCQHPPADCYNAVQSQQVIHKNFMEQSVSVVQSAQQDMMSFTSVEQYQVRYARQPRNAMPAQFRVGSIRVTRGPAVLNDFTNNDHWRPHSASFSEGQRRTMGPKAHHAANTHNWSRNGSGSYTALHNLENEDMENHFEPVNALARRNSNPNPQNVTSAVELLVTNLDQTMDSQELRATLLSMFQEHAMMLNLSLFHQSDGNLAANLRVASSQDAQYVISQLHRRKVGHKRILISNAQSSFSNPHMLRTQVIALLQEAPGNRMPLFKFRELLESRYRSSVSVSELYKLRDVCFVSEEIGGRMISLCADLRTTPSPRSQSGIESPHCIIHCPNGLSDRGWAEPETAPLPNVMFKLKVFTTRVHELLHSHGGRLPLPSFPICYERQVGAKMPVHETGVPLEHLITCVVGVELWLTDNMVKYVTWKSMSTRDDASVEDGNNSTFGSSGSMQCVSPPLASQLALFSRELVDVVRTAPHCQLPFSKFIPSYHHHFGRQCRVADYGYTKLVDLLDSLPHIIQIIGEGNKRLITLSHCAQVRRFTSDMLRVLKSQASKQVALSEFAPAYERVLSRPFDPVDYGLCEFGDLLNELAENIVVIKRNADDVVIAIPKREQTPEEIVKMRQFAVEVVALLRHAPQYRMLFNKFVPAYHHHYGHQCRVSDYGFTKLIELFEAIPDVVKIEDDPSNGDRSVSLTTREAMHVAREQITALISSSDMHSLPLTSLPSQFLKQHGYPLQPELYECSTVDELVSKIPDKLQLVPSPEGPTVCFIEESVQQQVGLRIWALLLTPPHSAPLIAVIHDFQVKHGYPCSLEQIEKYSDILELKCTATNDVQVSLTALYMLAARLYTLLFENGGILMMGNLDGMYMRKYGKVLRPSDYNATTLNALLMQLSFLLTVRGRKNRRNIMLNVGIVAVGAALPPTMMHNTDEPSYNAGGNVVQWPPPPAHTLLFNSGRAAVSPPKPDTPPTQGNFHWDSPNVSSSSLNLCIPLPFMHTPPLMENASNLISPMKSLLPAYPVNDESKAPEPQDLPLPCTDLLAKGTGTVSPSKDSGIGFSTSLEEPDSSTTAEADAQANTPSQKRRPSRLAANFTTPFKFT